MATTSDPDVASDVSSEIGWGVGSVAARLDIAPSTLRTWERRYDVGPSRRTAGGHRRYTETDIDRVLLTQLLIARGAPPRDAARVAHSLDAPGLAEAINAEHGRAAPGDMDAAEMPSRAFAAAKNGNARQLGRLLTDALDGLGAVQAWTEVVAPTLIEIGAEWSAGRLPIEVEHLASEVIAGELRAYTRRVGDIDRSTSSIVLAGAEDDPHSLPLFAMEASLAEAGMGSMVLGARLPMRSLASVVERQHPQVVFLWASLPRADEQSTIDCLIEIAHGTTLILAGPGWPHETVQRLMGHGALGSADLPATVRRIGELVA
jgi:DNA-binding transcriptional MerR regulator